MIDEKGILVDTVEFSSNDECLDEIVTNISTLGKYDISVYRNEG